MAEADESDGSFLMLSPTAAVVTCIEAEHLDNYKDLAEIEATFAAFIGKIREGGLLVAGRDDPRAAALAAAAAACGPLRVRTYGESPDADYRVTGVTGLGMATRLTVVPGERAAAPEPVTLTIGVPGRHNALNATAAFAAAVELGLPAGAGRQRARRLPRRGPAHGAQGRGGRGARA